MNFGKRTPAKESEVIIQRALERGVSIFDTANVYNEGESERILGRALRPVRDSVLVASKVGLARLAGKPEGLSASAIQKGLEASLARLRTEYLDVYYLHAPDPKTPIAETLDAMHALLESGKVRAWGVSNYSSWQVLEMLTLADARKMPPPVISQVIYNLLIRQIEIEYVAFSRHVGLHTTTYNALAGGLLTGRYARETPLESAGMKGTRFDSNALYQRRYWSPRMFDLVDLLKPIAEPLGLSLVELSYAWLASRPVVDSILVGPVTAAHLDAAMDACALTLPPDAAKRIDEAYRDWLGTDTNYVR